MDELKTYLKNLSQDERAAFAVQCGTSIGYLQKALSMKQLLGAQLCVAIEQQTSGVVTRKALRPDDWEAIWPELAEAKAA
jgi:DNA-binding transcriptional regulator YdaS (Cro superfamily)